MGKHQDLRISFLFGKTSFEELSQNKEMGT